MIKSASRRALLYWLLLLVPTLTAGAGALWFLHREQLRIDEQAHAAVEARKTAVNDRARLIAENIEVLVVDVQNGLMTTLKEAPSDGPTSFLSDWKHANLLVHDVFQSTKDGRIRWGIYDATVADWLQTTPWHIQKPLESLAEKSKKESISLSELLDLASEKQEESKISTNAAIYESQRNIAQSMSSWSGKSATTAIASRKAESKLDGSVELNLSSPSASASQSAIATEEVSEIAAYNVADQKLEKDSTPREQIQTENQRLGDSVDFNLQEMKHLNFATGWAPWIDEGKSLHLFGWRHCANGTVLVVEVDLPALAAQLGQVLPESIPENESYLLRRNDGSIVRQVGSLSNDTASALASLKTKTETSAPTVSIPLSSQMLPGWTVEGTFITDGGSIADGRTFFVTSSVLVALFVITILSGGALLLRQARISEIESLQKTSFVANVSHELKTPLTSIRLHAELLEQNRIRDEQQRAHFLGAIGRETQRLTRLVNNVLDFSRLEQGRRKLTRSNIDLVHEINQLLDCHAPRIEEAGLTLTRELPETAISFNTDADALGQIIINLIDNACKYAASGGELTISLSKNDSNGSIAITIADRGPGIPAAHQKRIFEKFHRVDNSLTAEQGGAGLGLSIARQLARALGGDLRYEPRNGGGSQFILTLQQ